MTVQNYPAYRVSRPNPPHGTNNAYVNYGCRCDECRDAHRIANADQRARRSVIARNDTNGPVDNLLKRHLWK